MPPHPNSPSPYFLRAKGCRIAIPKLKLNCGEYFSYKLVLATLYIYASAGRPMEYYIYLVASPSGAMPSFDKFFYCAFSSFSRDACDMQLVYQISHDNLESYCRHYLTSAAELSACETLNTCKQHG